MPVRIKRAMDYLYANAQCPIMLADIAESASLTVRGLQVGFLRHQGMSPMAFLRKIRLERARGFAGIEYSCKCQSGCLALGVL